jgi:hypothetical protein
LDAQAFHAQPERAWCHFHGLIDFYVNVNLKMGGWGEWEALKRWEARICKLRL